MNTKLYVLFLQCMCLQITRKEPVVAGFRDADDSMIMHSIFYVNGYCRKSECNFGNIITDSFIYYKKMRYKGDYWTDTPIALMPVGNVEETMLNKSTTFITLKKIFGEERKLVTVEIKGIELKRTLQFGLIHKRKSGGDEFLQVSGLKVNYDTGKGPGKRLFLMKARCAECYIPSYSFVVNEQTYRVVTTKNLYEGAFGHTTFANNSELIKEEEGTDLQAMFEYIGDVKTVTVTRQDRIVIGHVVGPSAPGDYISMAVIGNVCNVSIAVIIIYVFLNQLICD